MSNKGRGRPVAESTEAVMRSMGDPGRADDSPKAKKARKAGAAGRNPLRRLNHFIREVVAELRKVIWPTRKDLITYTTVVLVFVVAMVSVVWVLDFGFAKAVLWAFGGGRAGQ
jgi:preprotein translocase subunit SecE